MSSQCVVMNGLSNGYASTTLFGRSLGVRQNGSCGVSAWFMSPTGARKMHILAAKRFAS